MDVGGYSSSHNYGSVSPMKLYLYSWHSINIVPTLSIGVWVDSGTEIAGRVITLTILGWVLTVMYRSAGASGQYDSGVHGLLWSRKRRKFYYA